jgi:hypothetical protein
MLTQVQLNASELSYYVALTPSCFAVRAERIGRDTSQSSASLRSVNIGDNGAVPVHAANHPTKVK